MTSKREKLLHSTSEHRILSQSYIYYYICGQQKAETATLHSFFPLFSSYIYNLINDASSLEYSTKSVVMDFARDGVVYLELRTTPRAMPLGGLDKAGYVEAVLRAIEDAQKDAPMLHTRLILSIDRRNTPTEASEVVALAKLFRGRGVVAVDLCGDPTKGDVSIFTPAIEEAKAAGLMLTIHFAEAEASASEAELNTIMSWMPHRLGHVIHVPEAVKRQIVERRGIGLELCLSCNVHAKMIVGSFEAHHFGEWWRVTGPIVVPCVSRSIQYITLSCMHLINEILDRRCGRVWQSSIQ